MEFFSHHGRETSNLELGWLHHVAAPMPHVGVNGVMVQIKESALHVWVLPKPRTCWLLENPSYLITPSEDLLISS